MPGLNGLELQQALTAADRQLPIVFITGHGDVPMSVRAMKAGAEDFLPKPFDDEELLKAVAQALNKSQREQNERTEVAEIGVTGAMEPKAALRCSVLWTALTPRV
jgi:FixJ family two-component response regulator